MTAAASAALLGPGTAFHVRLSACAARRILSPVPPGLAIPRQHASGKHSKRHRAASPLAGGHQSAAFGAGPGAAAGAAGAPRWSGRVLSRASGLALYLCVPWARKGVLLPFPQRSQGKHVSRRFSCKAGI